MAWGTFPADGFVLTAGRLARHASSEGVERGFCAACGGALVYRNATSPDEIDVTLSSLDDPAALAPERHIWTSHRLSWVVPGDGLPQHPERAP